MFLLLEKQHLTHSWSTCFKVVSTVSFFPDVAAWGKESFEAFFCCLLYKADCGEVTSLSTMPASIFLLETMTGSFYLFKLIQFGNYIKYFPVKHEVEIPFPTFLTLSLQSPHTDGKKLQPVVLL